MGVVLSYDHECVETAKRHAQAAAKVIKLQ